MATDMKVLVVGATGETGRRVVKQLRDRQLGSVKALVRDRAVGEELFSEGVEVVVGDLGDRASLDAALSGCTHVISAAGARPSLNPTGPYAVDCAGVKTLTDAAKASDIQQLVLVSSLCVSKFFHPLNLFWLILFWKRKGEAYLQNSGLPYTIVRPGGLKLEDNDDKVVLAAPDTLFEGSLPRTKVAQVCVDALLEETAQGKVLEIVARPDAPAKSLGELIAALP